MIYIYNDIYIYYIYNDIYIGRLMKSLAIPNKTRKDCDF